MLGLLEAAGQPKAVWVLPGAAHVAVRPADPPPYDRRVLDFFDAALLND